MNQIVITGRLNWYWTTIKSTIQDEAIKIIKASLKEIERDMKETLKKEWVNNTWNITYNITLEDGIHSNL